MSVVASLSQTIADLLEEDPRRVLLGEDVREGGMLGLSKAAAEEPKSRERVIATPLHPAVLPAYAAGLALAGLRPVVLLPSAGALVEGLAALREAARVTWRTAGARTVPIVFVAPTGPGFGLGAEAGEPAESVLATVPGLRVVCVGRSAQASACLRAAAGFEAGEDPSVVLLPRSLLLHELEDGAAEELPGGLGGASTVREGSQATVFAWGATVDLALQAVADSGLDARVVDVVGLAPLDASVLVDAARATGKVVVAHAGPRRNAIGAELAAMVADEAILHLDAPVVRVTGADAPRSAAAEATALPTVSQIAEAITRVATF